MEQRTPEAFKALDDALAGKLRGYRYAAARDILTWTDPDRNRQKHEVSGGGVRWIIDLSGKGARTTPGVVGPPTPRPACGARGGWTAVSPIVSRGGVCGVRRVQLVGLCVLVSLVPSGMAAAQTISLRVLAQ